MEQVGRHFVLLDAQPRLGGLSTIRKGIDMRDGSAVAVKFVIASTDEVTKKVFERESQALRSLDHRNIVRIRDSGLDEADTYFLVLDWVDRCLTDVLEEGSWAGWDDLYEEFVDPLLAGLSYAHLKQLEHRDIKPGNVLIDANGQPLLADFGIAKIRGEEEHSELTLQHYRSGPYAPPERDATIPYVRDVYSIGVLILQCLSKDVIRDFPDVKPSLEAVDVPPEVLDVLAACVSTVPTERPSNASDLAGRLKAISDRRVARRAQSDNQVFLELTKAAQKHLAGEPIDRQRAGVKLLADLSGEVHAHFGLNRESGQIDRTTIFLIGAEHRYTLRLDVESNQFTVTAAPAMEFEKLEGGRRNGMSLPPIFTWTVQRPLKQSGTEKATLTFLQLLDEHNERRNNPETAADDEADEVFEKWLNILDAREELGRGDHADLLYRGYTTEGRRTIFKLVEPLETDLIGSALQVVDQQAGRKYGYGEIIDQETDRLTLLPPVRPLAGIPGAAALVPYNQPSAIALNRQRNAVNAVRRGGAACPELRSILVDPARNPAPTAVDVASWSEELDPIKQEAVQLALGADGVLVIQGPPGTGKTRFITEAVIQFLRTKPGARVLIASQTHVAVDNAVERLHTAGVTGLVRLAGADESVVQPGVRSLLLDTQVQKWSDGVRKRAEANLARRATEHGLNADYLRAALTLEKLAAVARRIERVEVQMEGLIRAGGDEQSSLASAVADEDPLERLQLQLDQQHDRRSALVKEAQTHLAGHLTITDNITSDDARAAVDLLLDGLSGGRDLLQKLELQAAWLEEIGAQESLASLFLAGTSVVAGTCTGFLRNKAVGDLEFDLCIVDEASKATLTEALVPMSRANRWILVGDTHQLPPTDEDLLRATEILKERGLSRENVEETLFQRFVNYLPDHSQLMLEEQYRMIKPIGDLISDCFYDGRLRSPRTQGLAGWDQLMGQAVTWIDTGNLGESRRESGTTSFANREEAKVVVSQLENIDNAVKYKLLKPERELEVLVIAPYKSQVEELRRRIAAKSFRHLIATVLSVDAVQGREADLALVSVTRSNRDGKLGFLGPHYWRRINVALSRARFGLTIIGDAAFIRGTDGALRNVLNHIERHPDACTIREAVR
ncbi:AAA domain-containing protein [Gordonia terrae]|uniref:AAA domain-containing protein n=1 Tax=Gordonia hongkongensis TaxID=1701090 RepID=UPI0022B49C8F|nr:AAA domain-containing protein [Gordonia terrae]